MLNFLSRDSLAHLRSILKPSPFSLSVKLLYFFSQNYICICELHNSGFMPYIFYPPKYSINIWVTVHVVELIKRSLPSFQFDCLYGVGQNVIIAVMFVIFMLFNVRNGILIEMTEHYGYSLVLLAP